MKRLQLMDQRIVLAMWIFLILSRGSLIADIIPPGNKSVSHKLVFVDSPELQSHRLIAMPVRGLQGFEEIQPGRPFSFSSKYGTRLYVVPEDYVPPKRISPSELLPFPSCNVPVGSVTFVPRFSPVASLRSTCKLVQVADDHLDVELVEHVELDAEGRPASRFSGVVPLLGIAATGLVGCWMVWRRLRANATLTTDS